MSWWTTFRLRVIGPREGNVLPSSDASTEEIAAIAIAEAHAAQKQLAWRQPDAASASRSSSMT
jgi:hypothetical protein